MFFLYSIASLTVQFHGTGRLELPVILKGVQWKNLKN